MRLSTDVFDALDIYNDENIRLSNIIATGGRYGLIPADKPFELSVNVANSYLEVVALSCHGVTRSGKIVDIDFGADYANTFDTRLPLPSSNGDTAFLLIVKYHNRQWREVDEMYSEPEYVFELIGENSLVDRDSLPIGRLVNQYGWRLDETDFVPPCLYVAAHPKYMELVNRAKLVFRSISDRCLNAPGCIARHLLGFIWQSAEHNFIDTDKRQDTLSPAELLASLQKVAASFVTGSFIDKYITLENPDPFVEFYHRPYDAQHIYRDIRDGLELCAEISIKMEGVCAMIEDIEVPEPIPTPGPIPKPAPKIRNRWEGIEI